VLALLRGVRVFLPIAAVSLVLWLFVVPELPRENAVALQESIQLYDADNAVALRYTEWQAATYMIEENPLLGVGTGGYQDHINIYYGMLPNPGGIKMAADTQNLYLVIGSSIGLPGLICFAGMLIWAMLSALRRHAAAASIMEKGAAAGAFGGLLAFAINAVWSPLLVRGLGIPLVFLFALAMGPRPDNDAPDSSR